MAGYIRPKDISLTFFSTFFNAMLILSANHRCVLWPVDQWVCSIFVALNLWALLYDLHASNRVGLTRSPFNFEMFQKKFKGNLSNYKMNFSFFNSKSSYQTRQFIFFYRLKWTCMTSLKILMESETMKLFQAFRKSLMMTDKYQEKALELSLVAQTYKRIKTFLFSMK